jgi:hypothetical protein
VFDVGSGGLDVVFDGEFASMPRLLAAMKR